MKSMHGHIWNVVFALMFVLNVGTVQAQTVERDGDTATAIRDLQLDGVIYDVEFLIQSGAAAYGVPPELPFPEPLLANFATEAVIDVLNAEGGIQAVGESASDGSPEFRVPIEVTGLEVDLPIFGPVKINIILFSRGETDPAAPDVWGTTGADAVSYLEEGSYAVFTVVDTAGSGNKPPVADAGDPQTGVVDSEVIFNGQLSYDPDGSVDFLEWDFGDGGSGIGVTPAHTYTMADTYNVILTVTDNDGASSSDETTATIGDSLPPLADAGGPYRGTVGAAVDFDGSGSDDPDGDITSYAWNFGDGMGDSGQTPSHVYTASGTYTVTLAVVDDTGETSSDTAGAIIGIGDLPPSADAGGRYVGVVEVPVIFDGTGSEDLDGTIMSYDWDYGDDTLELDVGPTPSHTYVADGSYFVVLTVTDDDGAVDSSGAFVRVPEPGLGISMLAALVTLSVVARSRRAWAR